MSHQETRLNCKKNNVMATKDTDYRTTWLVYVNMKKCNNYFFICLKILWVSINKKVLLGYSLNMFNCISMNQNWRSVQIWYYLQISVVSFQRDEIMYLVKSSNTIYRTPPPIEFVPPFLLLFYNRKWNFLTIFPVTFMSATKIYRVMIFWKLKKHQHFSISHFFTVPTYPKRDRS